MPDRSFRFSITLEVRWRDVDALGHVNNAVYFTYLEQARVHYMRQVGLDFREHSDVSFIIAEACCTYHSPLTLGEQVTVHIRVSELRNSSFIFAYRVQGEDGRLAATGRTAQVCYDYRAGQSRPIPDSWRAAMVAFEPGLMETV